MRTTWILALIALGCALLLAATACTPAPAPPGQVVDANECDLVSCEAGAAFTCCPIDPVLVSKRTKVVSPLGAAIKNGWAPNFLGFGGTSRGCLLALQPGRFALPLPLEEGDRLLGLKVAILGDGFTDLGIDILSVAPDGSLTLGSTGTATILDAPSVWTDYAIDVVPTIVSGGVSYWIEVGTSLSGACVGAFRLTYDRI